MTSALRNPVTILRSASVKVAIVGEFPTISCPIVGFEAPGRDAPIPVCCHRSAAISAAISD